MYFTWKILTENFFVLHRKLFLGKIIQSTAMKFCLIIHKPEVIKVSQIQAVWVSAGRNMPNTEQKLTQASPQEFIWD